MSRIKTILKKLEIVSETNRINLTQREALRDAIRIARSLDAEDAKEEWIPYDAQDFDTRPTKDDTYLVHLSSGKVIFAEWENRKWLIRGGTITHYKKVKKPV